MICLHKATENDLPTKFPDSKLLSLVFYNKKVQRNESTQFDFFSVSCLRGPVWFELIGFHIKTV